MDLSPGIGLPVMVLTNRLNFTSRTDLSSHFIPFVHGISFHIRNPREGTASSLRKVSRQHSASASSEFHTPFLSRRQTSSARILHHHAEQQLHHRTGNLRSSIIGGNDSCQRQKSHLKLAVCRILTTKSASASAFGGIIFMARNSHYTIHSHASSNLPALLFTAFSNPPLMQSYTRWHWSLPPSATSRLDKPAFKVTHWHWSSPRHSIQWIG